MGAATGGLTSGLTTWLTQRTQARARWPGQDALRRQDLYKEFIEAAASCHVHALQHKEADADVPALKPPAMVDVLRHRIDAVKLASRVHRRQHCGCHSLAATQVAPGEPIFARRRHQARYNGHVVEPGRRGLMNESAHIRDIRHVALDLSSHHFPPAEGQGTRICGAEKG